jgi:uncharacterized protein YjbI with pentapeptide repeats
MLLAILTKGENGIELEEDMPYTDKVWLITNFVLQIRFDTCMVTMEKSRMLQTPERRILNRDDVIALIADHEGAKDLDLSYTDLSEAHLGSNLEPMPPLDGAIFGKYGDVRSGTLAENAFFQRTSLRGAKFTGAVLRGARFYRSDLTNADLRFADLTNANLVETCLVGATLFNAQLAGARLTRADLRSADLFQASFSGQPELSKENIGEYLLQENEQEYIDYLQRAIMPTSLQAIEYHLRDRYFKAAQIYQNLRIQFQSNGRSDDAVWAYRKEKRMRKKWNGQQAQNYWKARERMKSVGFGLDWLGDWIVEILCDYGESIWRVMGWILVLLFLVGPVLIDVSGGLVWNEASNRIYYGLDSEWLRFLYSYFQHLLYMLDTITTASFLELRPANDIVRLASGLMAAVGIFLLGLLGFVAGNRIRS